MREPVFRAFAHSQAAGAFMYSLILSLALVAAMAMPARAQERPRLAVEVAAGTLLFPDDSTVKEPFAGAAGRVYLSPRLSVGPEIAFISGERHSHLMVTGNLTFDLLRPMQGRARPVTPFLTAGAGLFMTREQFPNETFTSMDGAFTAGGGVRALVGRRLLIGGEARVGWELHLRINAFVGVQLPSFTSRLSSLRYTPCAARRRSADRRDPSGCPGS